MVSILGNVKYSDGTISVLKDFSLLSSNTMGQIIDSLRIYSLLDLHIHVSKSGLWKSTIHVYLDLHVYYFFQNSTLHVYSRLHVYSERESTLAPPIIAGSSTSWGCYSYPNFFDLPPGLVRFTRI